MTKLYSDLVRVYHEMYQSIFDYKKEFRLYDKLLKKYKCKKILEIGCGTGNLALFFLKAGYNYTGLDISNEMLEIAREVEPKAKFIQGDMRNLKFRDKFDAILITGRSFTYMETNKDVISALKSVHNCLNKKSFLIFDNFDATSMFSNFKKSYTQKAKFGNREYKRVNKSSFNLKTGWTKNWDATYYIKENGKARIVKDHSILRAFTQDELKLFLSMCGFKTKELMCKKINLLTIAQKI